jgi:hypothetical protein
MQCTCKLCGRESELQESHIVPKFIYKYLKNTSPTGKLREGDNINLRKQDGIKLYWLCKECETMFSKWEKYFFEHIFSPLQKDVIPINYDDQFLKFCVSISWRVLKYHLEQGFLDHFSNNIKIKMDGALKEWKKCLLGEINNPGIYEQHFYNFTGTLQKSNSPISSNFHRYLQRSVDIDVINWGPQAIIVYTKFPGLLLIGVIFIEHRTQFRDMKIHVNNGVLRHEKNMIVSDEMWSYINYKAEQEKEIKNCDFRNFSIF